MSRGAARWTIACAAVLIVGVWYGAANDGRLHWDEPGYLYTAAFFDAGEIIAGDFQPSGNVGFSSARIGHILFAHALYALFGVGPVVIQVITFVYLALIVGAFGVTGLVLRSLGQDLRCVVVALALTFCAPVYLWLSFKTMPEAPALFFACVSVLALLRSLERHPVLWFLVGTMSLTGMALFKATLSPMFASFAVTSMLFGGHRFPRRRVLAHAVIIGAGSLVLFGVVLRICGIPLEQFLASWGASKQ